MDVVVLTLEEVPCWYELSHNKDRGILVRIHQDFVSAFEEVPEGAPIVEYLKKEHEGKDISLTLGKNFGVNDSLKFLGESDGFLEYHVPVVLCRKSMGKCKHCGGSGKNADAWDTKCYFCDTGGEEFQYDYAEAIEISSSLGLLSEFLRFPNCRTSSHKSQLLSANISSTGNRFFVNGSFGIPMVKYLRSRGVGNVPELVQAMVSVYDKMEGRRAEELDRGRFSARVDSPNGWLNISCPGQACGLNPYHGYNGYRDEGYNFGDHNVDQPMQQMTLFASVCTLHDLARSAGF